MDNAFQRWVDLARPRLQLWRTLLGAALIVAAWFVWTNVFALIAIGGGLITPDALQTMTGQGAADLSYVETIVALAAVMATFWGLWIGVWAVSKWLHKRSLSSVIAADGRFRLDQFAVGMALAAVYLTISGIGTVLSGAMPSRSPLPLETWLIALAPMAILIFLQSAGEELFFRGYLVQQLAARAPNPIVWGFVPSLLFGLVHYFNGGGDPHFAAYYVFAATMLGLVMTATVWRTGGLSVAMGFHLMNNIGAMMLISVAGVTPAISLFVVDYRDMMASAPVDLLVLGLLLAFVLSPFAPLPKGQPLRRK